MTEKASPTSFVAADLHHRFGAFMIDWHIRTIPLALWGFWIFFFWFPDYWRLALRGAVNLEDAWRLLLPLLERSDIAVIGWLCVAAYLLYHPVVECLMHGDSPGKRMMHITVRTLANRTPSVRQILLRNLWRVIEFLPFAWLLGGFTIWRSPENARIGDVRTRTRVVMMRGEVRR